MKDFTNMTIKWESNFIRAETRQKKILAIYSFTRRQYDGTSMVV